jgi:hypothetical protein
MQVCRQRLRRHQVLLRVVEAAAVHRPQLAVDALFFCCRIGRRLQAEIEKDEVERCADPRYCRDHMREAQQQVDPVEQVGVHALSARARGSRARHEHVQLPRYVE